MNDEIKQEVRAKILQFMSGKLLETNKVDFKREWYDLKDVQGKSEFFKDCCAIVNSYGGDDGFIIFGVGEDKVLYDAPIKNSGYDDAAKIRDIVEANIDKAFRFDIGYVTLEDKTISFIHLHPSTDKPHVVLEYVDKKKMKHEREIFVRSGSAKVNALKADLDRMYSERSFILVERKADVSLNMSKFSIQGHGFQTTSNYSFERRVDIENTGTRPLSIVEIRFNFHADRVFTFVYAMYEDRRILIEPKHNYSQKHKFVLMNVSLELQANHKVNDIINARLKDPKHGAMSCDLVLASGEILPANLFTPLLFLPPTPGIRVMSY